MVRPVRGEAGVAAIDAVVDMCRSRGIMAGVSHARWAVIAGLAIYVQSAAGIAAVLSEQRVDAMYHFYDGGGVRVTGPALLVRKNLADTVSLTGSYYADTVSSASIDVVTTASPFKEKRNEYSAGIDYLHGDSLMSLAVTKSEEPDYIADMLSMNYSQDIFGGMTTVTMAYSRGQDTVLETGDPTFTDYVNRYQYRLGLSQILTRTLRVSLDYEAIIDEGYLNSPYRVARIAGAGVDEQYPRSRESRAVALRTIKYLMPQSSVRFEYRYFSDTWDITADTVEAGYSRNVSDTWLMELRYRYYSQNRASFYSDNFTQLQNFMARDKELSTFKSHAVGGKLTYTFQDRPAFVHKSTFNVAYDHVKFEYDDFTDTRTQAPYAFNANVIQLFLSAWF